MSLPARGKPGKEEVRNWVESAEYDLGAAEAMLACGKYIYTVFMCHLAVEKALKAKVQSETGRTPPRTHSLRHLLTLSRLEPPEEMLDFLSRLSEVSIPTRYPEDFAGLFEAYDRQVAMDYLAKTREAFEWISKSLGL